MKSPLRVLLVEDNPTDALMIQRQLERSRLGGAVFAHCTCLRDAITRDDLETFDVALVDLTLPDASEIEAPAALARCAPRLPIIVLTGQERPGLVTAALRGGAQDYLDKENLDSVWFQRAIDHAIDRQHLAAQIALNAAEAREAAALLERVLASLPDAVLVIDGSERVLFANQPARDFFGDSAELRLVSRVLPLPDQADEEAPGEFVRADGQRRLIAISRTHADWRGQAAQVVTVRDVTDRFRAHDLEHRLLRSERLAALGRLAAGVAHEINNPAAFIATNLSVVRDELEQRVRRGGVVEGRALSVAEHLEIVRECLDGIYRIGAIARDLRTHARLDRDDLEEIDVNAVVRAAAKMLSGQIRHHSELDLDLAELPKVVGHRTKLIQVLTNLLANALDAVIQSGPGDHRIAVATTLEQDKIIVSVEDTGPGIPAELHERVFDPFFTTKGEGHGVGLGLALCAEIVRSHGGDLELRDGNHRGACFVVRIPLDTGLSLPPKPENDEPMEEPKTRRHRLLIIDDEVPLLKAFGRILSREHEVVLAPGGREGMERLQDDGHFDVILCDLMMPEIDGPAIYEHVRTAAPALLDRFVFCTGGAVSERLRNFLESIPCPILHKPFALSDLHKVIDQVTERSGPMRPNLKVVGG